MKVLRFPEGHKDASIRVSKGSSGSKMNLGRVSLTCAECNHHMHADFKGMMFRSVELYCEKCGTFYRLTNPGFSPPPAPAVSPTKPRR
jgi:hypothetical protein